MNTDADRPIQADKSADKSQQPHEKQSERVLSARELLQGGREIVIEHDGERYRLRLTRRNRLILQK